MKKNSILNQRFNNILVRDIEMSLFRQIFSVTAVAWYERHKYTITFDRDEKKKW